MRTLIIHTGPGWDQLVTSLYYAMHTKGNHPTFMVRVVDDEGPSAHSYTHQKFRVLSILPVDASTALIMIQETQDAVVSRTFSTQNPPLTFAGMYNHGPAFGGQSPNLPKQCLKEVKVTGTEGALELLTKILPTLA
jgi:hypothetical protein